MSVTVVPIDSTLSIFKLPFCAFARILAVVRPSPNPSFFELSGPRLQISVRVGYMLKFDKFSFVIPIPTSCTDVFKKRLYLFVAGSFSFTRTL